MGMQASYAATRLEMCSRLFDAWIDSSPLQLIFGLGSAASYDPEINGIYPHVQVVELLCELGIVGLFFGLLIGCFTFLAARTCLRLTSGDPVLRSVAVGFISLVLLSFVLSFKQGSLLTNYALFYDVIIVGRFAQVLQRDKHRQRFRSAASRGGKIPMSAVQPIEVVSSR